MTLRVQNVFGVGLANAQVIVFGAYGIAAFTGNTDVAGQILALVPRGSYQVQVWHNNLMREFDNVEAPGTHDFEFPW